MCLRAGTASLFEGGYCLVCLRAGTASLFEGGYC